MEPIRSIEGLNAWKCPKCNNVFTFSLIRDPWHIYDLRPNECKKCGVKFDWEFNAMEPPKKEMSHDESWNECIDYLINNLDEFQDSLWGGRYDYFPLEDLQEWLEGKKK